MTAVNDDSTFDLLYWKGRWKKEGKPWEMDNGELWRDTLPNGCIFMHTACGFHSDKNKMLENETYSSNVGINQIPFWVKSCVHNF